MVEVRIVDSMAEREAIFAVRQTVFVEEQGVDAELEYDEYEDEAMHFIATDGDTAVGSARLRESEPGIGKVERVAVLDSYRDDGVGRAVMNAVEEIAREQGLESLKLHSQTRAAGFYRRLGYEQYGDEFEEAGIPHVKMRKSVA